MLKSIGLTVIAAAVGYCQSQEVGLSSQKIREHTRALAADAMEGRGVGQRGGDLATEYIANQLSLAGAKPAGENGTFFQKVPLVGVEPQPESTLNAAIWGKGVEFKWGSDFVGVNLTQR